MPHPIIFAKRQELDVQMQIEGQLPEDVYGVVLLTSPTGSVNSGGLPFPAREPDGDYNREYGSPLMNGDGMIFKLDFNQKRQVSLKTRLMKTPCYYADEATKIGGAASRQRLYRKYGFRNTGIARLSLHLGARNELNTAIIPFRFGDAEAPRLLATYDVGRPFELDPASLTLITPIGQNTEWTPTTPGIVKMPFPLVQSTAHPVFDPLTKEVFTVNYTRSLHTMISSEHFRMLMLNNEKKLEEALEKMAQEHEMHHNTARSLTDLQKLLSRPDEVLEHPLKDLLQDLTGDLIEMEDAVYLMRWNGQPGLLQKWRLLDEQGQNLRIRQSMHQVGITQDYILLSDSSFKFTVDLLINNPFPHNPRIDRFLRQLLSAPMLPYLSLYLVNRKDLHPHRDTAPVTTLKTPIPLESVHFSANYANPNQEITVYLAHNSAACMAEWLRTYDTLATQPGQPVDPKLLGMFAIGAMDINRIGKFVIDAQTATIREEKSKVLYQTGNPENPAQIGAHTWEMGLYTYRDMIAPDRVVEEIKHMYFISYGLDPRMLSEFIFDLYKDYPNRLIPVEDIRRYSSVGLPPCLICVETEAMEIVDFYQLPFDYNLRSVQFMPRQQPRAGVVPSRDGYLLCTLLNVVDPQKPLDERLYQPEIWIFEADDLQRGPICKLTHPDLSFAFTLHSAWLSEAQTPQPAYKIDIRKDYDALLAKFWWPWKRRRLQRFFDKYVYPPFEG